MKRNAAFLIILAIASLLSFAPETRGAVDMFLKIDGIDGESRDEAHRGEIEIHSFSWGVSNQQPHQGAVQIQDLVLSKPLDKSSPKLFLACATGQRIPSATLTMRKQGESGGFVFLVVTFEDLLISSYQTGGSSGDSIPLDSVSLNFSKITMTYTPQRETGEPDEPVVAVYDVKQATAQ